MSDYLVFLFLCACRDRRTKNTKTLSSNSTLWTLALVKPPLTMSRMCMYHYTVSRLSFTSPLWPFHFLFCKVSWGGWRSWWRQVVCSFISWVIVSGGGFPLTLPMRWTPNEILSLLIFSPPALQLRYLHEKHRWEAEITCPHLHGHWQEEGEMQVGILRTEARRMDRFGADTDSCAVGFHFVPEKQDHEMRQYS